MRQNVSRMIDRLLSQILQRKLFLQIVSLCGRPTLQFIGYIDVVR